MAQKWVSALLAGYHDKISLASIQRFGVTKSAILSGDYMSAANVSSIPEGSLQLIMQSLQQRPLVVNSESFRIERLCEKYLLVSNPANKFITRILIVSDMQTIILVGTNTFQSLEGLEEVGRILAEMLAMNRRIAHPKFVRAPEVPAPTMKTTSYMEYDFASEEQFVFKFKVFERIGFNTKKS